MRDKSFDPKLPTDLTPEQITELCRELRDKALEMNPNVDITQIEIGFGMHTEIKNFRVMFRTYGIDKRRRTYFSRDPIHDFIPDKIDA